MPTSLSHRRTNYCYLLRILEITHWRLLQTGIPANQWQTTFLNSFRGRRIMRIGDHKCFHTEGQRLTHWSREADISFWTTEKFHVTQQALCSLNSQGVTWTNLSSSSIWKGIERVKKIEALHNDNWCSHCSHTKWERLTDFRALTLENLTSNIREI